MRLARSHLSLVALAFALVACTEKPKPDTTTAAIAPSAVKPSSDTSVPVPIQAAAATTAADGTVTRSFSGDHFDITVKAPGCKAKTPCTAEIKLTAKPGYHLNEEYPYKFAGKPAGGMAFKGKATPDVFSRNDGDFLKASAGEGALQIRYEADGTVKKVPLSGVFKMSVCSDAACQIESPTLDVDVPLAS